MKIQPINLNDKVSLNNYAMNNLISKTTFSHQSYEQNSYNPQFLQNYFINFTGGKKQFIIPQNYEDRQQYDNIALDTTQKATSLAKSYKHPEVNHYHFMQVAYNDVLDFIDKYKKGQVTLSGVVSGEAPDYFMNIFDKEIIEKKEYLNKFEKVVKEENEKITKILKSMKTTNKKTMPKVNEKYYNDVEKSRENLERDESVVDGFDIYNGAFCSSIPEYLNMTDEFRMKVYDIYMCENRKMEKNLHFASYDSKAENVIKNLNLHTNMMVTYDRNKVKPDHFIPSIIKMFEQSNERLNPKNTEIVEFNKNAGMGYFTHKVEQLTKNKDKNYILIYSQQSLLSNSLDIDNYGGGPVQIIMPMDYVNLLKKTPKNIQLVVMDSKDNYLNYLQSASTSEIYQNFGEISIPVLNSEDISSALKENKKFVKELVPNISKDALEKIIAVSSQIDGMFPDKTINLIKKIAIQYPDKKEITLSNVEDYIKDADYLFRQSDNDSSVKIVFDTNKRLKDIVGKTNTKKEAEYIINQIKSNKIGTKGYIIYNQDGMSGGGRRHTAEVIAGDAKVPFVSINTMDFGTKEVDLFGGGGLSPEASIKKLFSLVNTQAEANPHKSVVLFIENFEYFSVGEMVSEYHQKAMAQLIREMENAEKKGLNIVVMGSVADSRLIGEAAMKSFKFNDNIEVSSPAFDEKERYEVLKYTFKDNHLKVSGNKDEQDKLLHDMAKTLKYFSLMELKSFVKKAESIAQERKHKRIDKSDLIESYLRITTGRPSTSEIRQHEKELTTKHECGHAVTLQVMNDLMKKTGKPWLIPDTVNFITLDPRGMYGGAMYHRSDINHEQAFERGFTSIVCSYGGHSAEKKFYDMDGSWGITCDLNQLTTTAETMVTAMGQGYYTGKISLANMYGEEDFQRNITDNLKDKIDKDVSIITKNALTVSDMIVDTYSDFINEFSDKYSNLVGTGDCLVDGDTFRKELNEWKERQSFEKQAEFDILDDMILDIIQKTKKGSIY